MSWDFDGVEATKLNDEKFRLTARRVTFVRQPEVVLPTLFTVAFRPCLLHLCGVEGTEECATLDQGRCGQSVGRGAASWPALSVFGRFDTLKRLPMLRRSLAE